MMYQYRRINLKCFNTIKSAMAKIMFQNSLFRYYSNRRSFSLRT
jgi:hypothetical protein